MTWTEKLVTPNKLCFKGTSVYVIEPCSFDGGQYRCKATDQSGQTIQSSAAFLFVDAGVLNEVKCI